MYSDHSALNRIAAISIAEIRKGYILGCVISPLLEKRIPTLNSGSFKNFIIPILNKTSVHSRNWNGIFNLKVKCDHLFSCQILASERKALVSLGHGTTAPCWFPPEIQHFINNEPELGL